MAFKGKSTEDERTQGNTTQPHLFSNLAGMPSNQGRIGSRHPHQQVAKDSDDLLPGFLLSGGL